MKKLAMIGSPRTGAGQGFVDSCLLMNIEPIVLLESYDSIPKNILDYYLQKKVDIQILNIKDLSTVVNFCKNLIDEGLINVVSFYEYTTTIASQVAETLGFQTPSSEIIELFRNKYRFRKWLWNNKLDNTYFTVIKSNQDLEEQIDKSKFPLIIKPINLTGSAFVRKCDNLKDLEFYKKEIEAIEIYTGQKVSTNILVEQYIDGQEFSVEIFNGKILCITRKILHESSFTEMGHDVNAAIEPTIRELIVEKIDKLIEMLNYKLGILHIEVKIDSSSHMRFIEVNSRPGGDRIPELIHKAFDFNMIHEYLKSITEKNYKMPELKNENKVLSIRFLTILKNGVYKGSNIDCINKEMISEYYFYKNIGENYEVNFSNRDRLMHIIVQSNSYQKNIDNICKFFNTLEIEGVPVEYSNN